MSAPVQLCRHFATRLVGGCALWTLVLLLVGCRSNDSIQFDPGAVHYQTFSTQIEYPDATVEISPETHGSTGPLTVRSGEPREYWDLTLSEVVQMALSESLVIREIGGRVVSAPLGVSTAWDPALAQSDPRSGPEAALAAFDAQFATSLFFDKDEQTFNNVFAGGGASTLIRDSASFRAEVAKTAATGTRFAMRNEILYDRSSAPSNFQRFPSAYNTVVTGEFRHPLMRGGGLAFNRIAGPNAQPGIYNGVLLGRINTDLAITDFEIAVRNLLRDVERTYWELYFAYRDLDARRVGRDAALETWNVVQAKLETGQADGEREALAREQYYAAQAAVENALNGTLNGAAGVYSLERRLRMLVGLPPQQGRLIRPVDEPLRVDLRFNWNEIKTQAFYRRPELRRQQWEIKRRELELIAARNFGKMQLDLVGLYRWRGFGDELLGNASVPNGSAFNDLFSGDLQGWNFGVELITPVGNRIGHTSIRHAQLQLARQHAIFREQEHRVVHEVSDAYAEVDRAYTVARSNYNRSRAAFEQVRAIQDKYETGVNQPGQPEVLLENVLEAQSRAVTATSAYYRSLVDYNLAVMELHVAKGTLLDFHSVYMTEGPWSVEAHRSAAKQSRRFGPPLIEHGGEIPGPVSVGAYPQAGPGAEAGEPPAIPSISNPPETLPMSPGMAPLERSGPRGESPNELPEPRNDAAAVPRESRRWGESRTGEKESFCFSPPVGARSATSSRHSPSAVRPDAKRPTGPPVPPSS